MAELRIPTEQIPLDILERLQAFLDGRSWITPSGGETMEPTMTSVLPQLTASTIQTTPSSQHGLPSHDSNMASLLQSTSPWCKVRSENIYTTSQLPSSPSLYFAAADQHTRQRSAASDEVDGGPRDSVVQIVGSDPQKRKILDALDHSGIISVFPAEDRSRDQASRNTSRNQASLSHNDSEIVRIFPDVDAEKTHEEKNTHEETSTQRRSSFPPRPQSVHVFGKHLEISPSSEKDGNFHPAQEIKSQSPQVSSSQQLCPTPPGHLASVLHCEVRHSPSSKPSPSRPPSRHAREHKNVLVHHTTTGRSPELPTPPQTPDDLDDEVFTYNLPRSDELFYRISTSETKMRNMRSSPARESVNLRRYSDRSHEIRHHLGHVGTSQQMSEPSFGDKQKTRKRLSFDGEMSDQLPNTRPHHHSDPTVAPPHHHSDPTVVLPLPLPYSSKSPTNSNLSVPETSRQCHSSSPTLVHHRHAATSTFSLCNSPSATRSMVKCLPSPRGYQTLPTSTGHANCLPQTPLCISSCTTGDQTVLEMAAQTTKQRSRLHSEGDNISHSRDNCSSKRKQLNSRRQTFSYGKRRREDQKQEDTAGFQSQVTWSTTGGDCACSKIAWNFLNMAEGAYRSVSQMDGTQAGLGRFRQELAKTNDILRDSLAIVQKIQAICEHSSQDKHSQR